MIGLIYQRKKWKLGESVTVVSLRRRITVPAGFKTDLASVPRIFWGIYPPFGLYIKAAIVHDYLYCSKKYPRDLCDLIFFDIMKKSGVSWITRNLFYFSVRLYGKKSYVRTNNKCSNK